MTVAQERDPACLIRNKPYWVLYTVYYQRPLLAIHVSQYLRLRSEMSLIHPAMQRKLTHYY